MSIPLIVALVWFVTQYGFPWAPLLPVWVAAMIGLHFLDHVKVVGNRNARYCPACRYDLGAATDTRPLRCPECGCPVEHSTPRTEAPTA